MAWDELESERSQLERLSPIWGVANDRQRLEGLTTALQTHLRHRLSIEGERVRSARSTLGALSPLEILKRGYAIVRDVEIGRVVSQVADAHPGRTIEVRVADGDFRATVES